MKKTFLIAAAALMTMGLSSCNDDDNKFQSVEIPITQPAFNIVSSTGGEATVGLCYYTFTRSTSEFSMTMSAENVNAGGSSNFRFQTASFKYEPKQLTVDGTARDYMSFSAPLATGSGTAVTNLKGIWTNGVDMPEPGLVPGYDILVPTTTSHYLYTQYVMDGSYQVRTFWPDQTFKGITVTNFPGQTEPFTTEDISYRIVMKLDRDNRITGKADVIFYDAKFAPAAPSLKAVVLRDLTVSFNGAGYVAGGTDIVPQVLMDGGVLTDNRAFTFDKFEFSCAGDMTGGAGNYEVAGKYKGSFTGSCIGK